MVTEINLLPHIFFSFSIYVQKIIKLPYKLAELKVDMKTKYDEDIIKSKLEVSEEEKSEPTEENKNEEKND